jgi:hypothetical protein
MYGQLNTDIKVIYLELVTQRAKYDGGGNRILPRDFFFSELSCGTGNKKVTEAVSLQCCVCYTIEMN